MELQHKIARRRFYVWMGAYVVAMLATTWLLKHDLVPDLLRIPVALIPMLPAIASVFPAMDAYRAQDELQRRVQSEGIIFSFILTAIITFTYGFLELYAGFPQLSMWFVWPLMGILWGGIGDKLAARRYR